MASLLLVALNTWTSRGVLFVLSDRESSSSLLIEKIP